MKREGLRLHSSNHNLSLHSCFLSADVPSPESLFHLHSSNIWAPANCLCVRGDREHFQPSLLVLVSSRLTSSCGVFQEFWNMSWLPPCWLPLLASTVLDFCALPVRCHWAICFSSPKILLTSFVCYCLSSSILFFLASLFSLTVLLFFQESEYQNPDDIILFKF